jgi:hypothetical protein
MIKRATIDGREATVAYLTKDRQPVDEAEAEMIHVSFDDGESLWAFPIKDEPAKDARPRIGRPTR